MGQQIKDKPAAKDASSQSATRQNPLRQNTATASAPNNAASNNSASTATIEAALNDYRRMRNIKYAGIALAIIVALIVVVALTHPASTMSASDTTTDDAATTSAAAVALLEQTKDAPYTHTAACYDTANFTCEAADFVLHTHDASCYADGQLPEDPESDTAKANLICQLPEISAHSHDASCYSDNQLPDDPTTDDAKAKLTCDKPEVTIAKVANSDGTTTTTYLWGGVPVATHTHTSECTQATKDGKTVLACELEDAHEHTVDCLAINAQGAQGAEGEEGESAAAAEDESAEAAEDEGNTSDEAATETATNTNTAATTENASSDVADNAVSGNNSDSDSTNNTTEATAADETGSEPITVTYSLSQITAAAVNYGISLTSLDDEDNASVMASESIVADGTDKTSGNIQWDVYSNGVLKITAIDETNGAMESKYEVTNFQSENHKNVTLAPWAEYKSSITEIYIDYGVTTIGQDAFTGLTSVKQATLPNSITTINVNAFWSCQSLEKVTLLYSDGTTADNLLPQSITQIPDNAFVYCYALKEITIPDNVTSIGRFPFNGCRSLVSVDLGNGVKTIGDAAFINATSLKSITLPASITGINRQTFKNCTSLESVTFLGNGLTTLNYGIFDGCSSLTSIEIPSNVTSIGNNAFNGCSSLTSIEIPENVTSIDYNAFSGCSSLTSIEIPSNVTSIGNNAFNGCSSLTSIEIPANVTAINSSTFENCSSLASITFLGSKVTTIGDKAFYNCSKLNHVVIPNGVTYIGYDSFHYCNSLTDISLPDTVTTIKYSAFLEVTSLKNVSIPSSVQTIEKQAFKGCSSITSIVLPSTLNTLGHNAFSYCTSLESITFCGSPDSVEEDAFTGDTAVKTVTVDTSELKASVVSTLQSPALKDIIFTDKVDAVSYDLLNTLTSTAGASLVAATFQGPNEFTYTGDDITLSNLTLTAGVYYVDANGNLYKLDSAAKTAALVKIQNQSFSVNYSDIFDLQVGGIDYTVNSIENNVIGELIIDKETKYVSIADLNTAIAAGKSSLVVSFEANNKFTINSSNVDGKDLTSVLIGNTTLDTGNYYVDKNGVCYKYETNASGEKIATLINCPSDLNIQDASSQLEPITVDSESEAYTVTKIAPYAFEGNEHITTVTVPDEVSSIGAFAFSNCTKLEIVNGNSLLEEVIKTLNTKLPSALPKFVFQNTDLKLSSDSEDVGIYKVADSVQYTVQQDANNHYKLIVSESGSTQTGLPQDITISVDDIVGSQDSKPRFYFLAENGCSIYNSSADAFIRQTNGTYWFINGQTVTYTTEKGNAMSVTFKTTDIENLYYAEITGLAAGDSWSLGLSITYDNYTKGGSLIVWPSDGSGLKSPNEVVQCTWTTKTNDFSLNVDKSSFNILLSGNEENHCIGIKNLAFTTWLSYPTEDRNAGQDPMVYAHFDNEIVLPEGLYWYNDAISVIRDGEKDKTYRIVGADAASKGGTATLQVNINGSWIDVADLTAPARNVEYWRNISASVNQAGNLVISWDYENNLASDEMTQDAVTISFADNIIRANEDFFATKLSSDNATYDVVIKDNVSYNGAFRYSDETQSGSISIDTTKTLQAGEYTFTKTSKLSGGSYTAMGQEEGVTFLLTYHTDAIFPVSSISRTTDTLPVAYYLLPRTMEDMFTTYGDKLTIEIKNGYISAATPTTVTTTNGESHTTEIYGIGVNTEYPLTSDLNLNTDPCNEQKINMTIKMDSSGVRRYVVNYKIYNRVDDKDVYASSGTAYIGGENSTYQTIDEFLKDKNFSILGDTNYTCNWEWGSDSLSSWQDKVFEIKATPKNSFMFNGNTKASDEIRYEHVTSDYRREDNPGNTAYSIDTGKGKSANAGSVSRKFDAQITLKEGSVERYDSANKDESNDKVSNGDITPYNIEVVNEFYTYEAVPVVAQLSAGQDLLVPVKGNEDILSSANFATVTDSKGVSYYKLKGTGSTATYKNVKVGIVDSKTITADHIVIDPDGTARIYWYLNKTTTGRETTDITYKTVVDSTNGDAPDKGIINTAWEGDHQAHRIYAQVEVYGTSIYSTKEIVTNAGTDLTGDDNKNTITLNHNSDNDETTDYSILHSGDKVVYRLKLWSAGGEVTLEGSNISDSLPQSSEGIWSKDNIAIRYQTKSGSKATYSSPSSWSVEYSNGRSQIKWGEDFKVTFTGTIYIYVTLTMPSGDKWTTFSNDNAKGNLITNVLSVNNFDSTVYHRLGDSISGVLQKGVYSTGSISGSTVVDNTSKTSRLYYANDSSVKGQVTYYFVLYNSGHNIMYLDTIQDVLPKGFTLYSEYTETLSKSEISALKSNGLESEVLNSIDWIGGDAVNGSDDYISKYNLFKITANTSDDGTTRLLFNLSDSSWFVKNKNRDSGNYINHLNNGNYDDNADKYYLKPNQGIAVKYVCYTNSDKNTEDTATNRIAMPIYDYTGSGVELSNATFSINNASITSNDDESPECYQSAKAASLGFSTSGYSDDTNWLASDVIVSRGGIKPGIKKVVNNSINSYANTDEVPWKIEVFNKGQSSMTDYTISDVMMSPYIFTGDVKYQIAPTNSSADVKDAKFLFNIKELFSEEEIKNSNGSHDVKTDDFGIINVFLSEEDDSGNAVLTIHFSDKLAAGLAPNYSGYLYLSTERPDKTVRESKDFINTAYLTPSQDFKKSDVPQGNYTEYDVVGDDNSETRRSISAEARVAISDSYATSSSIEVTEQNVATTNSAEDDASYIVLQYGNDSIRYDLSVHNTPPSNFTQKAMSTFVLINNLPQKGDHLTAYTKYDRNSEFTVRFDNVDNLNFVVKVGDSELTTDDYIVEFSTATNYDYSENTNLWSGQSNVAGWYTLDYIEDNNLDLSDMRSFRVRIDKAEVLTKGNTITVSYNAKADLSEASQNVTNLEGVGTSEESSVSSNLVEAKTAWNSFGYYYTLSNKLSLSSGSAVVGVRTPTIPRITKELVDSEYKTTSALADDGQTCKFLITKKTTGGNGPSTVAEVKVGNGASEATISLDGLYQYTKDASGAWKNKTTTLWTWEDGVTYTVTELDSDYKEVSSGKVSSGTYSVGEGDSAKSKIENFAFFMIGGKTHNSYEFVYDSSDQEDVVCKNERQTWSIVLSKKSDLGQPLGGAKFALYTDNAASAMTQDEYETACENNTALKSVALKVENVVVDKDSKSGGTETKTLYLMNDSFKESNASGAATWADLDEDHYYLLEVEPPTNYAMGDKTWYTVDADWTNLEVFQKVINYTTYQLPNSGGLGDYKTLAGVGVLAVLGVLFATGLRQRRRLRQLHLSRGRG